MTYYAGHVPTKPEQIVATWTASAKGRKYTNQPPRLTEMNDGEDEVLALTLSSELVTKIQIALSMGRHYRLSTQYTKAKLEDFRGDVFDNKGLVETLEFELQLKKKELEQSLVPSDEQKKELRHLAQDFYHARANQDVVEGNISMLEEGDKKEFDSWRDAWFEVDRLLDIVWMDAGLLKRYENVSVSADGPHQSRTARGINRDGERASARERRQVRSGSLSTSHPRNTEHLGIRRQDVTGARTSEGDPLNKQERDVDQFGSRQHEGSPREDRWRTDVRSPQKETRLDYRVEEQNGHGRSSSRSARGQDLDPHPRSGQEPRQRGNGHGWPGAFERRYRSRSPSLSRQRDKGERGQREAHDGGESRAHRERGQYRDRGSLNGDRRR